MNSFYKQVKEYYKKTESFIDIFVLYIGMLNIRLNHLLNAAALKLHPYYRKLFSCAGSLKGYAMCLFQGSIARRVKTIWSSIDFYKPYQLSSGYGIGFLFMIVIAINLAGFNIMLTWNSSISGSQDSVNIMSSVKTEKHEKEETESMVSELEIFQQIIRHSDMDQHLALKLASIINTESKKYNIDPYLILSVIQIESRFSPKAVSHKGARGLMQLMPTTGKYVASKYDLPLKNTRSLFDPVTNIRLGVAYLSYLENMYGNMDYALFAYNHGPKKTRHIKKTFSKSRPYYVKAVMNFKQFLETERQVTES